MQAIRQIQPMAFNARWCNVCLLFKSELEIGAKLYNCSGCQLVQYCSEGHQRIDWPLHKDLCRAVQSIMKAYKASHIFAIDKLSACTESLESRVLQVKLIVRLELDRALHDHEEQLTSYPNLCTVCFKTRNLKVCRDCQGVSYCSEKCKQTDERHHDKICSALRIFYCPYKMRINDTNPSMVINLLTRVPRLHETNLIDAMRCSTQKHVSDEPYKSLEEFQLFSNMANFSCIATICYALERTQINSLSSTKFVIYIIGAEAEPSLYFSEVHTKFFFLQYPQITALHLCFIGPNLEDINQHEFIYKFQGKIRKVYLFGYRGLFQKFCALFKITPSIIISFNCGFSERTHCNEKFNVLQEIRDSATHPKEETKYPPSDTWTGAIYQLVQTYQVPIVFTSFTLMEAQFDYGVLAQVANSDPVSTRIDRIFPIHQNPYRDPRAIRNIVTTDDEEIYYCNGYIQGIYTRVAS